MRKIVTICGSFRFKEMMERMSVELSIRNDYIVLMPIFGLDEVEYTEEEKQKLKEKHFDRIRMSDAIFVVNQDNYIRDSTKKEIEYAKSLGKEILSVFPLN